MMSCLILESNVEVCKFFSMLYFKIVKESFGTYLEPLLSDLVLILKELLFLHRFRHLRTDK